MLGSRGSRRREAVGLLESSPLRAADPRTKLVLCLATTLAVVLPLHRLAIFVAAYAGLLLWARLLPAAARQVWRLKWVLVVLFAVDWLLVGLELAGAVTLRLVLLAGAFAVLFSTTTPAEFVRALEWMRVPHRYAFSVGVAFRSIGLLDNEWHGICEAQRARGAWRPATGLRQTIARLRDLVALAVPAVVLTARGAWSLTEAAYARGFDSPRRRPYRSLAMKRLDWALLAAFAVCAAALLVWR